MATTTNYGWTTPDDTALVKDGAAAIRTLGSSVDTTTKNLNPSTTLGDIEFRSSTSNVNTRLGIGATGTVLTVAAGVPSWATPASGISYAVFNDTKSSGTGGGTFTSGAFRTRDINTTVFNGITGASIASNQITLAAGTYYIDANAPAYQVNNHVTRLQNITDSTTTLTGSCVQSDTSAVSNISTIMGAFTIAASKTFEVQHRAVGTFASTGFGLQTSFSDCVYTQITVIKVA
jgi:hypothetical protein